ncbi:MAG: RNA methyltransferase [Turicibacter sp.]|nr:RNA methyltransferase [Turicibacter sp.]
MLIESNNNTKVKKWTKLKQKKYRYQSKEFIVEGEHLVLEAMTSNVVKEILVKEGSTIHLNPVFQEKNIPIYLLKEQLFMQIASTETPQPIMAICEMKAKAIESSNRLLLLDRVQDPGNLGALLRSAVAFGFDGVVLGEGCVDVYNEKVIRSTQGAIFKIPMEVHSLKEYISVLKENQVKVYGTSLENGKPLGEFEVSDQMAFILGNEGQGVDPELLLLTDKNIFIEMTQNIESLNVSIAGSIIMYQFRL